MGTWGTIRISRLKEECLGGWDTICRHGEAPSFSIIGEITHSERQETESA
jgi:hypothetical protein